MLDVLRHSSLYAFPIAGVVASLGYFVCLRPRRKDLPVNRRHCSHPPAFRAGVALAALETGRSPAELAERFGVSEQEVEEWKRQLQDRAVLLFVDAEAVLEPRDMKALHSRIAELATEIRELSRSSEAETAAGTRRNDAWEQLRSGYAEAARRTIRSRGEKRPYVREAEKDGGEGR